VEQQGALILVADDDQDVCKILGMFLKRQGHRVLEAYDGCQAWDTIRREQPDLVLLDIMMPGLNGLEVCRHVRATPGVAATPVIIISALVDQSEIIEGFKAGANDYVTKPFLNAEVLARVRSALRQWQLRRQVLRREQLESFDHELDRILGELEQPLIQLVRNTKRLRDLTAHMDAEKKEGALLYQHGMRTYLIVKELRNQKEEIRHRLMHRDG